MAKKPNKKQNAQKRAKKITIPLVFVSLVMIVVFKLGFVFFTIGLLPSIVSYYIDSSPQKHRFHTVFPCNLAGVLPSMVEMLIHKRQDSAIQAILSDSTNWLVAYGAAGLGWGLVFATPFVARQMVVAMHTRQLAHLKGQQKTLIKKWGEELIEESKTLIQQ